jgi:hypothetical protein
LAAPLPSLPARLWIALTSSFRVLADPAFAARVDQASSRGQAALGAGQPLLTPGEVTTAATAPARPAAAPAAPAPPGPSTQDGALLLLSLLQREGRLLDFCEEELAGFNDATIGAAARLVHDGCRKALRAHFTLEPIRSEGEGAPAQVDPGFDPRAIRLSGNVVGAPPFRGTLRHHGWRAAEVRLPEASRGAPALLVAPAEVELP